MLRSILLLAGVMVAVSGCVISPLPPMPSAYIIYAPNYPVTNNNPQAKDFAEAECQKMGKSAVPANMPNCGYGNCTTVYQCQ